MRPLKREAPSVLLRSLVIAVALASVVVSAGCDTGDGAPETQPAPATNRFTDDGIFDALPQYPRSDPAGPRREVDDAVIRTWEVRNAAPDGVLRYYREALAGAGWHEVDQPHAVHDSWRGSWRREGAMLEVSAGPAPTADAGSSSSPDPVTQYSLTLRPE